MRLAVRRLEEEQQKAAKAPDKGVSGSAARDALWAKAAVAAAEKAVDSGRGRDQPPMALAAALTFFVFERHTPKTAPSSKQVADAAGALRPEAPRGAPRSASPSSALETILLPFGFGLILSSGRSSVLLDGASCALPRPARAPKGRVLLS